MNSTELQKKFPEIYRDFFSKNDLVMSGCFSFPWGSIIWDRSNNILIKSKIPLKTFVGIKEIKGKNINYRDITIYDIVKWDFSPHSLKDLGIDIAKISTIIQEFLTQNNYSAWLEISGLSEISRGHSFWFAGTFFATLATGLFILVWKIKIEEIKNDYEAFSRSREFREIFLLAWRMELVAKYGNTIGQNVMHTLQGTANPSYFYAEKYEWSTDIESVYSKYVDIVEEYSDRIVSPAIPLDYAVIFSWISTSTKVVEAVNKARGNKAWQYSDLIRADILGEEWLSKDIYIKKFAGDEDMIRQTYDDIIALSWVKTLDLFIQLFTNGFDEYIIDDFITNIDRYRHTIGLIEKLNNFAEDFVYHFRKNQKHPTEKFAILPIYSGKMWGGYLVVMKPGVSRDTLSSAIKEMKNYYPNIEVEYSSFADGICSDGPMVEQYVSKWVFSPYVQADKVLFKNNVWESYLGKHSTILENETKGLLVDTIANKIYLNGIKLTSKEIPSQNATADILNILLERVWEDVSNKELPSSSYSTNKNEMLGKIVIPLVKLLEEQVGKTFPFVCKGEIADFYVKLDATTIPLSIVRKL